MWCGRDCKIERFKEMSSHVVRQAGDWALTTCQRRDTSGGRKDLKIQRPTRPHFPTLLSK